MKNKTILLVYLVCWLFLSSCASSQVTNTFSTVSANRCIPPLKTFAFPSGEVIESELLKRQYILPSENWIKVTTLPENVWGTVLEFTRVVQKQEELWIETNQGIYRYRLQNHLWDVILPDKLPFPGDYHMFLSMANEVWLVRGSPTPTGQPLLARYNDKGGFDLIQDQTQILGKMVEAAVMDVKVDKSGIFWMMIQEGASLQRINHLFSYNPVTMQAVHHLSGKTYDISFEVAPDNSIFLLDHTTELQVVQYMPATQVTKIYYPEIFTDPDAGTGNLYFDRSKRLWMGDQGWFDFSDPEYPRWYTIVRSPVFISYIETGGVYRWPRPDLVRDSVDGFLWFRGYRGMVRLDPQRGEWCLFTTYTSNIIEDSQHNLWMLLGNDLYQYIPKKK
jgi:ligand-binding sensor domain-containing protein